MGKSISQNPGSQQQGNKMKDFMRQHMARNRPNPGVAAPAIQARGPSSYNTPPQYARPNPATAYARPMAQPVKMAPATPVQAQQVQADALRRY